jgi:hypothetical protein
MIDQLTLRKLFSYVDGALIWSVEAAPRMRNKRAGALNGMGYRQIRIHGTIYPEHRVVFMYHYGWLPKMIDHIDGDPTNNRIENLRPCTQQQNRYNTRGWSKRQLPKGVTWNSKDKRYQAQLSISGKNTYLGQYVELEDAVAAVNNARRRHHGEFAKY